MGYCGGLLDEPNYRKVCHNDDYADYAESIQVDYDPEVLPYETLLEAFFRSHDPRSSGRSRQYMSAIFFRDEAQHRSCRPMGGRGEEQSLLYGITVATGTITVPVQYGTWGEEVG